MNRERLMSFGQVWPMFHVKHLFVSASGAQHEFGSGIPVPRRKCSTWNVQCSTLPYFVASLFCGIIAALV
jgi:hypothetical protein